MKLVELVGKQALRATPIVQRRYVGGGSLFGNPSYEDVKNYMYTTDPVFVAAASRTHAVIVRKNFAGELVSEIIGEEFNDNCWVSYSKLADQAREMIKEEFPNENIEIPDLGDSSVIKEAEKAAASFKNKPESTED